ncbi:MAG: diguanylate cyclase [Legionella sp.]|nr:diguanylate cyclase [Legionella sp.]
MDIKVQKKLQDLFITYTKKLPEKIKNIEVQWQKQLNSYDKLTFQNFHRDVHSLCGSAGTYGYTEIGKAARVLEIFLKSLLNADSITIDQQQEIEGLIENIKKVALVAPEKLPVFAAVTGEIPENKLVYIVEQDINLVNKLSEDLKHAGYQAAYIPDLSTLKITVNKSIPITIILDTNYLSSEGIDEILALQKLQPEPIQLFCIVPDADLQPRLQAIRARCNAFFQKPIDIFFLTQLLNQKCSVGNESYRILIIDDSESLGSYYSLILSQAGMVTHAISNPMLLLNVLEEFQPDLLLMDIYMPQCTGLELAAVLRQENLYKKIPIIFLSTEEDKRKQLSALSLGGDDFLTKPISPQHLISAVRSRAKRAGVLNYFMTTDSLTGLLNHSSILKRLEIEIMHAKQKNIPLSFVMIDIDHFKKINDTYGHPVGDIVIKKLATLLLVRLRSQDIVGRYGGEEFAIILPGASHEKSRELCNELREQFSRFTFASDNTTFSVTFSMGISYLYDGADAQIIVDDADKALYKAKQLGRNQVVVFDNDMD